jgi:hypothetical protein
VSNLRSNVHAAGFSRIATAGAGRPTSVGAGRARAPQADATDPGVAEVEVRGSIAVVEAPAVGAPWPKRWSLSAGRSPEAGARIAEVGLV